MGEFHAEDYKMEENNNLSDGKSGRKDRKLKSTNKKTNHYNNEVNNI